MQRGAQPESLKNHADDHSLFCQEQRVRLAGWLTAATITPHGCCIKLAAGFSWVTVKVGTGANSPDGLTDWRRAAPGADRRGAGAAAYLSGHITFMPTTLNIGVHPDSGDRARRRWWGRWVGFCGTNPFPVQIFKRAIPSLAIGGIIAVFAASASARSCCCCCCAWKFLQLESFAMMQVSYLNTPNATWRGRHPC